MHESFALLVRFPCASRSSLNVWISLTVSSSTALLFPCDALIVLSIVFKRKGGIGIMLLADMVSMFVVSKFSMSRMDFTSKIVSIVGIYSSFAASDMSLSISGVMIHVLLFFVVLGSHRKILPLLLCSLQFA